MITDTTPQGTDQVAFELELAHAPAKVWRALTDPALLSQWLLPVAELSLEVGARFRFQAPPMPGWDGSVACQLAEIEPLRRLRWSWVVGDIDTEVTFTLTPTASGTHLALQQTGFKPHQKQNLGCARYGWKMMAGKLIDLLAQDASTT
jgi:uncharacterized protein YndB with AHSA1/START domain